MAWGYFTVSESVGLDLLNVHGFYQTLSKYVEYTLLFKQIMVSKTDKNHKIINNFTFNLGLKFGFISSQFFNNWIRIWIRIEANADQGS